MNAETSQAWIALVATAGAIAAFFYGLRSVARGRLRELENIYFERYWKIIDQLDRRALLGEPSAVPGPGRRARRIQPATVAAVRNDDDDIRKVCVLYLRLCEDELRLRESGFVSEDTWRSWKKGMRLQIKASPVQDEWLQIEGSDDDRFRLLRRCCPKGKWDRKEDPLAIGSTLALWRGASRTAGAIGREVVRRRKKGLPPLDD